MTCLFLDFVGAPAYNLNEFLILLALSPVILGVGFVIFFKLLDKWSDRHGPKKDTEPTGRPKATRKL